VTILETARLTVRKLSHRDAAFIVQLLNEPDFIRFIADRHVRNEADAISYLDAGPMASYERNGFGLWCVERKIDQAPIGMCGLIRRDTLPDVDIGYAYLSDAYGQGYATEAARGVLAYGRGVLALPRIVAIVDLENAGSIHVLEKIGLTFQTTLRLPGDDADVKLFA
jgi:[ribosomal protein S5]-alanine N-acetyltransferase